MGLPRYSDYQVKDYLSFHEPGPLHTYDRVHVPSEHKYDHMWQYKYSNKPGSQILRVEEQRKPRKPVKRLQTPQQGRARTPAKTKNARSSPKGRASPTDNGRTGRNTKPTNTTTTTTPGTRRPARKPQEMWQYKDYLSYHEPGPYHDYQSFHQPSHHPYNHMWTYRIGNRPGSQHVRVEPHQEPVKRRVVVKPRTATPKPRPRQQPVKKAEEKKPVKAEEKKTMRAEERKVATPPPPQKEPVRRAEPVPPPPPAAVTQPQRQQQAPPPVKRATPPPRHTTPPPPRHTTPPPRRQVTPPRRQVTPPRRQVTPPRREVTPPRRRYSPPPSPVQHYRAEPAPVVRSAVVAAAAPRDEPTYQSRIPVRRSYQAPPPRLTPRLSPPSPRQPLLRRDYRLRPESKWNAPRLDLPRYQTQQRRLRAMREEREQPRWKPIRTYNGIPRQGPLSTNYGDHTLLYDYSKPAYYSQADYRPPDYSRPSYPRYSYPQNDHYYPQYSYRYEPSYYTGYKDPLSSVKRTMVLYGV